MFPLPYRAWKESLLQAAGTSRAPVEHIGDFVLELFWRDGCEPTITALLDYAQAGLPAAQAAAERIKSVIRATEPQRPSS